MQTKKWQCRVAPSLGDLESSHDKIWGTDAYTDDERPTVFMGLYGLPDFFTLWRHKGERHVLWCGTDIIHFANGYWLEEGGEIRVDRHGLAKWIDKHCTNWCENNVEAKKLQECGINAIVQPSFLGDVNVFSVSFKPGNKVYASVSGNNFELYGWDKINDLALINPQVEFHLYGNTVDWKTSGKNIIVHGRVPKEQMNAEIMEMQAGLRMVEFDGASEIIVKAMLMGQYAFSLIDYPFVNNPKDLSLLLSKKEANLEGRKWWRENLNKFPWNVNFNTI